MYFGVVGEEFWREIDEAQLGGVDLELVKDFCGDHFIYQNAGVLRVILELDDIEPVVIGLKQVGLGSAAHFSNEGACVDWHAWGRSVLRLLVCTTGLRRALPHVRRNSETSDGTRGAGRSG